MIYLLVYTFFFCNSCDVKVHSYFKTVEACEKMRSFQSAESSKKLANFSNECFAIDKFKSPRETMDTTIISFQSGDQL